MKIEIWSVDKLIPYARNPRKGHEAALKPFVAAIKEFGFRVPILARSDGEVVDGHLRLKAALALGMTEVPVVLCDDMTPAQVKAFRISINRMADLAEWDFELLALEVDELKALDFDLEPVLAGLELPDGPSIEPENTGGGSLASRFGVPPFSVLNAREGAWQDQKRAWLALGIKSELGRGGTASTSARSKPGEKPTYRQISGGGQRQAAAHDQPVTTAKSNAETEQGGQ